MKSINRHLINQVKYVFQREKIRKENMQLNLKAAENIWSNNEVEVWAITENLQDNFR